MLGEEYDGRSSKKDKKRNYKNEGMDRDENDISDNDSDSDERTKNWKEFNDYRSRSKYRELEQIHK